MDFSNGHVILELFWDSKRNWLQDAKRFLVCLSLGTFKVGRSSRPSTTAYDAPTSELSWCPGKPKLLAYFPWVYRFGRCNHSAREGSASAASLPPPEVFIESKLAVKFQPKKRRDGPQLWWLLERAISAPWNLVASSKCACNSSHRNSVCSFCVSSEHQSHAQGGCAAYLWPR